MFGTIYGVSSVGGMEGFEVTDVAGKHIAFVCFVLPPPPSDFSFYLWSIHIFKTNMYDVINLH